jgi:hypothetical protein
MTREETRELLLVLKLFCHLIGVHDSVHAQAGFPFRIPS